MGCIIELPHERQYRDKLVTKLSRAKSWTRMEGCIYGRQKVSSRNITFVSSKPPILVGYTGEMGFIPQTQQPGSRHVPGIRALGPHSLVCGEEVRRLAGPSFGREPLFTEAKCAICV